MGPYQCQHAVLFCSTKTLYQLQRSSASPLEPWHTVWSCEHLLWLAGTLLRSLTFPASIHTVVTDPADHALYAGAGDGSIFETSLVGAPVQPQTGSTTGELMPAEGGYYTLQGGTAAVTCLGLTGDTCQMVSGQCAYRLTGTPAIVPTDYSRAGPSFRWLCLHRHSLHSLS